MDLSSWCIFSFHVSSWPSHATSTFLSPCRVSHLPPQSSELNEHKQIRSPCDSLCFKFRTSLSCWGSMSHLTTTLLWKPWASPGLPSKQMAYSDVQQWNSHRLCYDVRQHHNISCRSTDLDIIDFSHMVYKSVVLSDKVLGLSSHSFSAIIYTFIYINIYME